MKIARAPPEGRREPLVLLGERDVRVRPRVGVDAGRDARSDEARDRMDVVARDRVGLHVRARADLQVDACRGEVLDQPRVFDAADAVADARGAEVLERLPDAVRAARLAGVRGAMEAAVDGVAECIDVRIDRKARLVAGDVEGDDASSAEALDQPRRLQALLAVKWRSVQRITPAAMPVRALSRATSSSMTSTTSSTRMPRSRWRWGAKRISA